MEMIVTLVRLVYYDVPHIRLKLEIADAVKFYVFHYVRKHTLNEDSALFQQERKCRENHSGLLGSYYYPY